MTTVNVQFADSSERTIITYFGSPQDPDVFPNLGAVATSDPRYKEFYDSLPDASGLPLPEVAESTKV